MGFSAATAASLLSRIREKRPLIHNMTNIVAASITANATMAAGAVPVMALAAEEVADMVGQADALVLNMGTPTPQSVEAMVIAGKAANDRGIPVVYDPVGLGTTPFRLASAERILAAVRPSVIRGNPAEVATLMGRQAGIKGVESARVDIPPEKLSLEAARRLRAVAAVTGPKDCVSDGRRLITVEGGHPLTARIVGSGCVATSIVAAFCSVERDYALAAACALAYLKACARLAAPSSGGPGTFQARWLDAMASITPQELADLCAISLEWVDGGRKEGTVMETSPPYETNSDRLRRVLDLYVITDSALSLGRSTPEVVRRAVAGGVKVIQLREKRLTDREIVRQGLEIRQVTRQAGALLIVNDRPDLALALDADGVHLGQDDLPLDVARRLLGPSKIVGATVETQEEARRAESSGADYLGTGPVFSTGTKPDAGAPYGTSLIRLIKESTSLPVVAVGGISLANIGEVAAAGADGAAVIRAVVSASDITQAVRDLVREFRARRG
jgi:hydroxyethylthiazole kinase/thiamine-phosphate diphosphorylase